MSVIQNKQCDICEETDVRLVIGMFDDHRLIYHEPDSAEWDELDLHFCIKCVCTILRGTASTIRIRREEAKKERVYTP